MKPLNKIKLFFLVMNVLGSSFLNAETVVPSNFSVKRFTQTNLNQTTVKATDQVFAQLQPTSNNRNSSLVSYFVDVDSKMLNLKLSLNLLGSQNIDVSLRKSDGSWQSVYLKESQGNVSINYAVSDISKFLFRGDLVVKITSNQAQSSDVLKIDELTLSSDANVKEDVSSPPVVINVPKDTPTLPPVETTETTTETPSLGGEIPYSFYVKNFESANLTTAAMSKVNDGNMVELIGTVNGGQSEANFYIANSVSGSGSLYLGLSSTGTHNIDVLARLADGTFVSIKTLALQNLFANSTAVTKIDISDLSKYNYRGDFVLRVISKSINISNKLYIDYLGMTSSDSSVIVNEEPPVVTQPKPVPSGGNGATAWILDRFNGAKVVSGDYKDRTTVSTGNLIKDATGCCTKYAFDVVGDGDVGFVNVKITDMYETSAHGAGIRTTGDVDLFMSNVTIEPNWPIWKDYQTTNYDGIDFDGTGHVYAEDLTIRNWNADGALDMKADKGTQFVRLLIEGKGNRALRYWGEGPHYLVDSSINNNGAAGEGSLLWFYNCSGSTLYVYNSTFNGSSTVPSNKISCDDVGNKPKIIYLSVDPRTTGEMHPMFDK